MGSYVPRSLVAEADKYATSREDLIRVQQEVSECCEDFLVCYEDFLNGTERCLTQQLSWGIRSLNDYKNKFLRQVLMGSYKVWDKSHLRYLELLKTVQENNPEWVEKVIKDHEHKLSMCKVSVFPIEEALTA